MARGPRIGRLELGEFGFNAGQKEASDEWEDCFEFCLERISIGVLNFMNLHGIEFTLPSFECLFAEH